MKQNNTQILGKSITDKDGNKITLLRHTKDVYNAFGNLKDKVNGTLNKELCQIIQLAIFLHDLGKVLPAFQIKSLENKGYQPFDIQFSIPHSLFSLFWINKNKVRERVKEIVGEDHSEKYMQWIISTVAYHHWRESFPDLIQRNNSTLSEICKKINNEWKSQLKDNLLNEFKDSGFDTELIGLNEQMITGLSNGLGLSEYATPPYYLYWLPKRIVDQENQNDWILISGFTILSDHFASYCEEEGDELSNIEIENINSIQIKDNIFNSIKDKLKNEADFWQAEAVKDYCEKNTILIAPTGYGKTEFSFLWSNGEKFFYTLPLRTAVDQIFKRARSIFDDEIVNRTGILHSDADVFLLGDGGEKDNIKLYDLAKQLSFPVNISTGDQFFPYALRPPGYEKIYAKFSYSRLVIDEVQAYDPKAAAIIVKFLEDIVRLGGKFLLMTATFPDFIKQEISKRVKQFDKKFDIIEQHTNALNIYEKDQVNLKNLKKHSIKLDLIENSEKDFSIPSEYLDKIVELAKNNRVLVILNTIQQAQNVWLSLLKKDIPKERIDLLHSRFTKNDRKKKEERLSKNFSNPKPNDEKEGRVLIATQIVEASLDIDADILFTELAPIDNLIQRMGRVLRRYRSDYQYESNSPNIIIWTFQNGLDSGKGYVYHKELQLATLKILNSKMNNTPIQQIVFEEWLKANKKDFKIVNNSKEDKNEIAIKENLDPYLLSDYEKYELVDFLYKSIPVDGDYLKEFYETLDILDAGYMSDRKSEAHKIFREIYSAEVIPEHKIDSLKIDIESFFSVNTMQQKFLYAKFKKDILSQYTLQIPLYKVEGDLYENNLVFNHLKVREVKLNNKQKGKLKRWLGGVYLAKIEYSEQGVKYYSEKKLILGESF